MFRDGAESLFFHEAVLSYAPCHQERGSAEGRAVAQELKKPFEDLPVQKN